MIPLMRCICNHRQTELISIGKTALPVVKQIIRAEVINVSEETYRYGTPTKPVSSSSLVSVLEPWAVKLWLLYAET